jgi:hypothetical protein
MQDELLGERAGPARVGVQLLTEISPDESLTPLAAPSQAGHGRNSGPAGTSPL